MIDGVGEGEPSPGVRQPDECSGDERRALCHRRASVGAHAPEAFGSGVIVCCWPFSMARLLTGLFELALAPSFYRRSQRAQVLMTGFQHIT